jgi:hypothetical protein
MYQAQVAYNYGVDVEHAIASLISVPAKYLGLDNRIGFIRPGYDADLVVWNRHPLRLGASPLLVTIDGDVVINATHALWTEDQLEGSNRPPPQRVQQPNDPLICSPGQKDLVVQGIVSDYFHNENSDMDWSSPEAPNVTATAVIRNGELVCVGRQRCSVLANDLVSRENTPVMNIKNGFLLPVENAPSSTVNFNQMSY